MAVEALMYTCRYRTYLTADDKPCERGDPAAVKLFAIPGRRIPDEAAREFGLSKFEDHLDEKYGKKKASAAKAKENSDASDSRKVHADKTDAGR